VSNTDSLDEEIEKTLAKIKAVPDNSNDSKESSEAEAVKQTITDEQKQDLEKNYDEVEIDKDYLDNNGEPDA